MGWGTNLELHAENHRQLADLQALRSTLRGVSTLLAVVRGIGRQILDGSEALQTAGEGCRGSAGSWSELSLLVLQLDIETEIGHGIVGVGGLAAFVTHDAAAKLTIECFVEEALALCVVTLCVAGSSAVKGVD